MMQQNFRIQRCRSRNEEIAAQFSGVEFRFITESSMIAALTVSNWDFMCCMYAIGANSTAAFTISDIPMFASDIAANIIIVPC